MIRILHSVSNMDRAGIETMLMNYYRHMDRSEIQFDFLCNKKKPGAYDAEIAVLGGRIYRAPGLNPLKYPQYLRFMKQLFQQHPEYRIVEAHNDAMAVYALHAAKRNQIPVRIFHAHSARTPRDWKMPLKLFCKLLLPLNFNRHFTCGIAAGRFYFGNRIMDDQDYVLIRNAIEIEEFSFDEAVREQLRESHGLQDRHVVGHVGRFCPEKNQKFLLQAFAQLKQMDPLAYLVFIGDGDQMEQAREEVQALGLQDSVSFLGNIHNVNEWYQAFDVFVLPSLSEGLPVVGVEAQTADLPCIFSDSITREIGLLDKTRFLPLREGPARWAQAIMEAFECKDRQNVRGCIAAHGYDIREEAKKLQALYVSLTETRQLEF